jgi:hypothetical protein
MTTNGTWSVGSVPDLAGKTIIITGANSGLGYEAARVFARKGAQTILACRSQARGEAALKTIRRESPRAGLELMRLDLADLNSIGRFAESFKRQYPMLHILCNNAGVMALPYRTTADGFEMQFGVNHLGHFALTGLLLDRLIETPGSRVVTVSSLMHYFGRIEFDDRHGHRRYKKWAAYTQSKLANLLFAYELQRRLAASGAEAISLAAHPGYAATHLQLAGAEMAGWPLQKLIMILGNLLFAQSAARGAWPILYAATAAEAQGGDYIGPAGFMELWGSPRKVGSNQKSRNQALADQLWSVSERLTGVYYEFW